MSLKEGQPCHHSGCLSHVTKPCEGCGRVAGQNAVEYCYGCRKDTETIGMAGGDCIKCGFSKVTPEHLKDKNEQFNKRTVKEIK